VANDIDITVGVKDLATKVLESISTKVNSFGGSANNAFGAAAERLNEQLSKVGSSSGGNDKLAKAIESATNGLSTKLDAAMAKTSSAIDSVTGRVQTAISSVTGFVAKAAQVATVGAAFFTVGRAVYGMSNSLGLIPNKLDQITTNAQRTGQGVFGVVAQFSKYTIAAGATVALTDATLKATSATTGLLGKVSAISQGALAAFVLRNALKKTEDGASTLTAKLAKVAGTGLAIAVVTKSTVGLGLSLVGLRKNADDATNALIKSANAGNGFASATARITAMPFKAVQSGASSAAAASASLASKIDELPKGAKSVNTLVESFGTLASRIGGIPGLLLAIPAGFAGIAFAAVTAAGQTDR